MAYKPILFNTDMVKAILGGRKTQTRRVLRPKFRENEAGYQVISNKCTGKFIRVEYYDEYEEVTRYMYPPCYPGDILWVREAWCDPNPENPFAPLAYKADFPMHWDADQTEHGDPITITAEEMKWKPSIHMPKEAARIFLRVKDVRAEKLHDIHEKYAPGPNNPVIKEGFAFLCDFIATWDSTIKPADREKYGWDTNPWVWVIEFERCEEPEGWCFE